tara:strand:+ start:417 stop:746 length:330 start_codon:yes stop_codon:yes gene_type:complete
MIALQEITKWDLDFDPNFIYLLDGDMVHAYINGSGEPHYFTKPMRFSKAYRKFKELDVNPFDVNVDSALIEVQGSKGQVYHINPDKRSCTCTGFSFRGKCKHVVEALGE